MKRLFIVVTCIIFLLSLTNCSKSIQYKDVEYFDQPTGVTSYFYNLCLDEYEVLWDIVINEQKKDIPDTSESIMDGEHKGLKEAEKILNSQMSDLYEIAKEFKKSNKSEKQDLRNEFNRVVKRIND